jgi:peptidoglycan-N-acetylglucosamine deacetylase
MGTAFGPGRLPSALVLTFDNLGEASELERGTWPAETSVGSHRSVTEALPRLLDELAVNALTATFFIEAINCELYPQALLEIVGRGHEIAMHGWRHEEWSELGPEQERRALARATAAFAALGIEVTGFRPPGGGLTGRSPVLLREAGISWCSPAGGAPGVHDRLAFVPFEWEFVDAYHMMESFAGLREARGDARAPLPPAALAVRMAAALGAGNDLRTLVLHPFLMLDDAWLAGVRELLAQIGALARAETTWVVSAGRFADWLIAEAG